VTALRWIVEQPKWRDRLGENARARVLDRYTWRHHVDAILDALAAAR
jgi:glycosyltransferase involved in cell wall biosynthesis